MPPVNNVYDTAAASRTDALAEKWHTADLLRTGSAFPADPLAEEVAAWPPSHVAAFLSRLLQFAGLSALKASTTRKMNELYMLDAVRNPEVPVYASYLLVKQALRTALCVHPGARNRQVHYHRLATTSGTASAGVLSHYMW